MVAILVLYSIHERRFRKTIEEHAFSFGRYGEGVKCFYLNVTYLDILPTFLSHIHFDGVIFHYSFLAMRYGQDDWHSFVLKNKALLRDLAGVKIAIPQDEYNFTEDLCKLFKSIGVEAVYTCASPSDYRTLYPEWTGVRNLSTVFTGYIDELTLAGIRNRKEPRKYDVGYRGRKLPYWLGQHAQLKTDIIEKTLPYLLKAGLVCDVRHTQYTRKGSASQTFLGQSWLEFLSSCRTVLGCLGGSSLMDYDGSVKERVEKYVFHHPDATFQEVEAACFPGMDGNISLFALSPRHFECAMTRTCQILVEGDYQGVFIPGKHFIELKKDFSNIDSVIELIKDAEQCRRIAEQCYQDVVASGKYTYRVFANRVVEYIASHSGRAKTTGLKQRYLQKLLAFIVLFMRPAAWRLSYQRFVINFRQRGPWWLLRLLLLQLLGPAIPGIRKIKKSVFRARGF